MGSTGSTICWQCYPVFRERTPFCLIWQRQAAFAGGRERVREEGREGGGGREGGMEGGEEGREGGREGGREECDGNY